MQRFWHRIAPYWHIGTGCIFGIIAVILWVNNVSGFEGRISALETKEIKQERRLIRIDDNIQMIGNAIGVTTLKKDNNDD